MNAKTRQALIDINRAFYTGVASAFSESRRDPWPGWRRALSHLRPENTHPPSILDVGCGNGRFLAFLESELTQRFRYLGLDSSPTMLSHAHEAYGHLAQVDFAQIEILDLPAQLEPTRARFDLIALFGVLHHIPCHATRRALLRKLAGRLTEGGILVVTAWQFGAFDRFRPRILPWVQYNEQATRQIDERELDAGDSLLRFGEASLPRYCHFCSPDELRDLLTIDNTEYIDEFAADGKTDDLNRYAVLRRS